MVINLVYCTVISLNLLVGMFVSINLSLLYKLCLYTMVVRLSVSINFKFVVQTVFY